MGAIMWTELCGQYRFDGKNTARIMAEFFHHRFEMRPGYDEALEGFFSEDDDEVANTRLIIEEDCLRLRSDEGEQAFPIIRAWEEDNTRFVELSWDGHPEQFEIQQFGEQSIRFANETNTLSQYVWEREGPNAAANSK